jgi:hypothetical protein
MATRSTIAYEVPEGIRAIYCHWDGYPEEGGVGETLNNHYSKLIDVINLLDGGDLSSLSKTITESVYYKDRGEDTPAKVYASESEWLDWASSCGCEYAYLFKNDKWIAEAI